VNILLILSFSIDFLDTQLYDVLELRRADCKVFKNFVKWLLTITEAIIQN
jgi:hypothetical protein